MGQEKDYESLIGQKFGSLTIIGVIREKNKRTLFECDCDCGNTVVIQVQSVLNGGTKSCGCKSWKGKKIAEGINIDERVCAHCGERPYYAKGYCRPCYERNRRNQGSPEYKVREQAQERRDSYAKQRLERQQAKSEYIMSLEPTTQLGKEMQRLWAKGMTLREIADKYGYSKTWVHKKIRGEA